MIKNSLIRYKDKIAPVEVKMNRKI